MIKYFNLIEKYYPKVNKEQLDKLRMLYDLYRKLNKKINLISRKDFENFYLHHIIHSLSLLNFINNKNIKIIDLGTGGGLPGLPLSIFLNKCEFYLIDSIKKKIDCVNSIINELNINNIHTINSRVEDISIQSDIIVSRATSNINNILMWTKNSIKKRGVYLLLKGGNVDKELINIKLNHKIIELENIYSEEYFLNKKIIKIYK